MSHPSHYTTGGIETIDVIEAWQLGFHLGNVVKYVSRAGKKDPARTIEDLRKARWYLDREIERITSSEPPLPPHGTRKWWMFKRWCQSCDGWHPIDTEGCDEVVMRRPPGYSERNGAEAPHSIEGDA